ncbi:uncharacterized protein LOC127579067 [Pristis pectinata]|uniref:uncharacterized protein LOC127579067 n=1 Tax=Pristis pectinata TaxID=685728 RepID=UPI00223E1FF8|nr:uncharacterized protein LOC127579067 [Pristis pectinata]
MQQQEYQADVEGSWHPEQLEDLQMSGNQCQGPETQPREWPRSPGQRADCQVSRPASERMATQSQWLDHQACGDQQLLCPAIPHQRDQVYDDGEDNWSCSQGGRCGIRAQRPDQEAGSSRGPGDGHQPHGSQVEAWLDGIERGHRGLRREGHRWQRRDISPESDATPRYSNQGQPTGSLPGSEGGFHPGCPFDQQQQPPCKSRGRGPDQQRRRSPQRSSPRVTCPKEDQAAQGGGAGESGRLPPREEEGAGGGAGGGAEGRGCRRWRLHQGRARCPQTGLPAEHLLRLSVKLGEPPARAHRKKRASHRSAGKRHPFPEPDFKPNSLSTKLHRDQRTELVLTSQDISKETTAKKKQLAQLLQMVASHTSHLLKGNMLGNR